MSLREGEKVLCACRKYHPVVMHIADVPVIECPVVLSPGEFRLVNTRYMFASSGDHVTAKVWGANARVFPDYDGLLWVGGVSAGTRVSEEASAVAP